MADKMQRDILLLFDRPHEPIYVPKGEEGISFNLPVNYLPKKYQPLAQGILSRFGNDSSTSVFVKPISIPDLSEPLKLSRRSAFSFFIPSHRKMAGNLIEKFMGMRNMEDLMSLAVYCRDRINAQMFIYALSVALIHRADTNQLQPPLLCEIFPDKFMDSSVFHVAKEEAHVAPPGLRTPIEISLNCTATDADPEHRVAYWREDVGINLHHWHWHLIYPIEGPRKIVDKDRRGELFYYMHHQIMARYNIERLCNNLSRVQRMMNLRAPIPEAYFPKLDRMVAGRSWPARPAGFVLADVDRKSDQVRFDLTTLELYRDRILEAIHTRSVLTDKGLVPLDDVTGIDLLGNLIEANSTLSVNLDYYGDLHNFGHLAIAFCHDPDNRFLEFSGVMGEPTTAMRDPVFYRWHAYIDYLFTEFKDKLPAYTAEQLTFPGVSVIETYITSGANPNTLYTHWTKSDVNLSRGLDFAPRGSVAARLQHLDHEQFSYNIVINNANDFELIGTVRVFMAPIFDETGEPFNFNEQRMLMIEMDKFIAKLKKGQNVIVRKSIDSAITIPFEATFRNLQENRPSKENLRANDQFNFCGCGWPQHMLVPKGTKHGYAMDLFVMITDYESDKVNQPDPSGCRDGVSFCGLRDLKYPDIRPMGFPFDRKSRKGVESMNDFLTPNMKLQQITVRFSDDIKITSRA